MSGLCWEGQDPELWGALSERCAVAGRRGRELVLLLGDSGSELCSGLVGDFERVWWSSKSFLEGGGCGCGRVGVCECCSEWDAVELVERLEGLVDGLWGWFCVVKEFVEGRVVV